MGLVRLLKQSTPTGADLLGQYRVTAAPELFAQIMRAYGGMVFSVCFKVTKDAADAEDASQATFLTLAVQCKTGAPITYLGPWLKKVAKRTSLDLVRSRKRRSRREAITAEGRPEHYSVRPAAKSEAGELGQIIRDELEFLPTKYRMPLVLHYFGGLSHEQIANEMRCTTAALGVRLHRARKMLGKRLTARNISLESATLGAAIGVAIQQVVTDRFMHATQAAATGMGWGAHPIAVASLPGNLGPVLELVTQVGHSMARARVKMATAALAASISVLGGAAEAVRHLPDSIRPNLDFLAPSQIIQNLLQSFESTPRVQEKPNFDALPVAMVGPPPQADPEPATPPAYFGGVPIVQPAAQQPVLALQLPAYGSFNPPPQTGDTTPMHLDVDPVGYVSHPVMTPALSLPTNDAQATSTTTVAHASTSFPLTAGGESSSGGNSSSGMPLHGESGMPSGEHPIASFIGGSSFDTPPSYNDAFTSPIGQFNGSASNGLSPIGSASSSAAIGPAQLPTGANAFTPGSIVLQPNDVFVHHGDGAYHWSDASEGIVQNGTNSANFSLTDVVGDGVISIERLPVTTTIAPPRPTGHHFVGIWSFNSDVDFSSITLTAHYDETFAESIGVPEDILKLWVYTGTEWFRIQDASFSRNLVNHSLTGTYDGMPEFFAVSAPEPTGIFGGLMIGGLTLLRRRRHAMPIVG